MPTNAKHRNVARLYRRRAGAVGVVAAGIAVTVTVSGAGLFSGQPAAKKVPPAAARSVVVNGQPVKVDTPLDVHKAVQVAKERAAEPMPDLSKMSLQQLQDYSVKMQTEFVQASMSYEEAQTQSVQAKAAADAAEVKAVTAQQTASAARDNFGRSAALTYQSGLMMNPTLQALASGAKNGTDFIESYNAVEQVTHAQGIQVADLADMSHQADALSAKAADLRAQAQSAEQDAHVLLGDIQDRAAKVAAAANKALSSVNDGRTLFASAEQQARNDAALKQWQSYLSDLDAAHVVPPSAQALADPAALPRGLRPLIGTNQKPVPGVAAKPFGGKTLTVLPKETIAAVSRAFAAMGKPYVAGNSGPETYDCTGLVSGAWSPSFPVPAGEPAAQAAQVHGVDPATAQVGDLVYFTSADAGVQQVGINLGGDLMLSADATAEQVGVQPFPADPTLVGRVTLPHRHPTTVPISAPGSPLRCGGTPASSAYGFVYPMQQGTFVVGTPFGQAGPMWSSGYHTGQDFVAPTGTPVLAAKSGTVTITPTSWGGPNMITIDHGDGVQTDYAHLSADLVKTGDVVQAGQVIGQVGALGNVTGPHLHFEVIVNGVKVDPMQFLAGEGGGASGAGWGGFANGMIPDTSLCPLAGQPNHRLRCDAAAAWNAMAAAYQKANHAPMCITDSYRSYAVQVQTYATKPTLAAVPGTSNHGWALAVDLCGGINKFNTPQYDWMVANAPKFGWRHPDWARQGGGREEPWHWEFGNIS